MVVVMDRPDLGEASKWLCRSCLPFPNMMQTETVFDLIAVSSHSGPMIAVEPPQIPNRCASLQCHPATSQEHQGAFSTNMSLQAMGSQRLGPGLDGETVDAWSPW
jgi:hypothetical protein